MNRVIAWFAANSVAANLLIAVIFVGGLLTLPTIKQEIFPEFETDMVTVSVLYPGASPAEIEETINIRIEEKIAGLEGVKKITSTAAENVGAVVVQAQTGTSPRELLDDVKSQVDAIDSFPVEAEEPIVSEVTIRYHVISVAIYGDTDEMTLKRLGEQVRDELSATPVISQVDLVGARPYEISIEVSEETLRRYGLTFDEVAEVVRRSSLDLPGGSIRAQAGEILLRTKGQAYVGAEFEKLVLRTRPDGTRLLLGDIATIRDAFAETDQGARFDGKPAVLLDIGRVGDQSALEISTVVREYTSNMQRRLPPGVSITTWNDEARILRSRIHTLANDGIQGLILVFVNLALFLQMRLALWVTFSIPVSLLGTLWLMPTLDISINLLSLFCFIMVLGIVVDDATVIAENVYKKKEDGLRGLDAVIAGTTELSKPVIFGVLTTCSAFLPMLWLPGATGKIMRTFPLAVIPALLFSLVDSQLTLPAHLRHVVAHDEKKNVGPIAMRWRAIQDKCNAGLQWFVGTIYSPFLERALEWRYWTASFAASVVILGIAAVMGGWIGLAWFPEAEADNVVALLTMPQGTPREVTAGVLARLEASAEQLRKELDAETETPGGAFRHVLSTVGEQPYRAAQRRNAGLSEGASTGSHLGEVNLQLAASEERDFDSAMVARRWRELTGPVADATELLYTASLFNPGPPIAIQLASTHMHDLQEAASRLKNAIGQYPGVYGVADSFRPGKEEIKLVIKPEGEALGLTLSDLARQVRQGFYGEEAQRVARGREDIKVMVRYPEEQRRTLATLEDMRVRTPSGAEVPFATVADVQFGRGYALIERADRSRVVQVTAEVDPRAGNANKIVADVQKTILPSLVSDYPGLTWDFEGEQREQREAMSSMMAGLGVSLVMIFALMAIPLRSYIHPMMVMSAIPFGVIGAIFAHGMLGLDLTFLSIFGIVALVGVVVNDSLVLVDYINERRAEGRPAVEVVREAGPARFRAIFLTSSTTFIGLVPILTERSLQAQFLVPMAVSLGFGVVFATFVSLVLVPCLYLIVEDLRLLPAMVRQRSLRPTVTLPVLGARPPRRPRPEAEQS
ncbi:MAG TPA: efflux RND transporter permease subunit [Candidatus Limnocylindrales bacterium]|nr:efflux RND transporter permease subunit [Candidatus Limnocylindrales bacterium]